MSRFLLFAALSFLCLAAPAYAQPQSDFEFAMDNQDYPAAEAAMLYEIARVGEGQTSYDGNLQLTLASLRVLQENYSGAIDPARRAQRILGDAEAPTVRVLLARAEFGANPSVAGAATLRRLLLESASRPEFAGHVHHGAIQIAEWAMREHRYGDARDAWRLAERAADASIYGANYGRGVSLIGDAAATLYATRPGAHDFVALQSKFEEGLRLLDRGVPDQDSYSTSRGERAYAQAVAWYRVWRAYAGSRAPAESENLPPTGNWVEVFPVQTLPICDVEITPRPSPRLPSDDRVDAGAAILQMRFAETGDLVEQRLIAVAGGDAAFADSIAEHAPRWRVEIDRQPGCSVTLLMTKAVVFRFRE